jgi:hypothetical protein
VFLGGFFFSGAAMSHEIDELKARVAALERELAAAKVAGNLDPKLTRLAGAA